jgi:peroxiredoxin
VSIDTGNIDKVKKYVEEHKLTFQNLHDPTTKSGAEYGVRGVPTTYLIDTDGKIIGSAIGPRPWDGEDVQKLVESLFEK